MSISDAKCVESWQIGFEDGIKFGMKIFVAAKKENSEYCEHFWRPVFSCVDQAIYFTQCEKCGIQRGI